MSAKTIAAAGSVPRDIVHEAFTRFDGDTLADVALRRAFMDGAMRADRYRGEPEPEGYPLAFVAGWRWRIRQHQAADGIVSDVLETYRAVTAPYRLGAR